MSYNDGVFILLGATGLICFLVFWVLGGLDFLAAGRDTGEKDGEK